MANEQTTVPLYAASEVLTAANMNISAGTGVPVFATTVTRDAAFGGANKALAEGQLCYLSASNIVQYYDGAAWATVGPSTAGGLTLISATTIGSTVGSVTVSSAFSATYDNYKIIVSGGVGSTTNVANLTLGATATGYYVFGYYGLSNSATITGLNLSNGAFFDSAVGFTTNTISGTIEIQNPNAAKRTAIYYEAVRVTTSTGYISKAAGFLDNATQYTAFTLTPAAGTLTGGTIRVYGYQNS